MKKLILSAIAVLFTTGAMAQSNDYYLPKTGISFIFEVQRDVKDGNVDYSFISVRSQSYGIPDETKHYEAVVDKKHTINYISKTADGILLGVNTKGSEDKIAAPKPAKALPKAGKDTIEVEYRYVPNGDVKRYPICHLSEKQGVLSGEGVADSTYYITIKDEKEVYDPQATVPLNKAGKDNANILVNLPGKITLTIEKGKRLVASHEFYAGQYGRVEAIDKQYFLKGKKKSPKYSLEMNPKTGEIRLLK